MSLFQQIYDFLGASRYFLLFLGTIVEGPVVMLTSGFLYRLGQFEFFPMYLTLMAGDLVADVGWYAVGYYGTRPLINKFGDFLNITPEIIDKIEKRFNTYQNKILFISKITMGFGFALATLIVAGMLKVPFKKYVLLNLAGGFIWTLFLIVIGYFFGNVYALLTKPLKVAFLLISAIFVIITLYLVNRYLVKTEI